MPNEFDPYREALVMETATLWSEEFDDLTAAEKQQIAVQLHAAPQQAADMIYIRSHTGFSRQITVTAADLERIKAAAG